MACEQDSAPHYYKINTWQEFLEIKCDKASKLYSVRCNQKLLFTDPGEWRKCVWDYFIPGEFCDIKGKEFSVNNSMLEEINEELGTRACTLLASHVNCVCECYGITNDCDKNDILNLVKVFTYCHRPLVYDIVWTYIIAVLRMNFESEDTYIYASFIVLHGFPNKFFSADDCFEAQNFELQVYSAYVEQMCPKLVSNLTAVWVVNEHEGKGCHCKVEKVYQSKEPYNVFIKKVADAHLVKLFACQISPCCFLQLLDLLMLDGFDFVHKVSIKIVAKMHANASHAVKKVAKGCNPTEDNLIVAGTVASCCLTKRISDSAFLSCMKSVFKDKKLDGQYSCFRETTAVDESLTFHVGVSHVTEKRLARIIKARQCLDQECVELDEDYTNYYLESIDYEVCCLKKLPKLDCDCSLTYDEFVYIFCCRKNGLFNWSMDCIHLLFLAVDFHNKCCVSLTETKTILTLISKLSPDNKLSLICKMNGEKEGKLASEQAKCIISQIDSLVISGDDHCQADKSEIDQRLNDKLKDENTISMVEFIEYSKSISELSALFAVMNCQKVDCNETLCKNYQKIHSPISQSPNLSFTKELTDQETTQEGQETIFESKNNGVNAGGDSVKKTLHSQYEEERNCEACSIY